MFRENVLCNDGFIDLISANMVPVAFDLQTLKDLNSRETLALKPWFEPGKWTVANLTGIWVLAPDGRILGRPISGIENLAPRTEAVLKTALAAFGPVAPRSAQPTESHPWRGRGVLPDGGVSLAEYVRESEANAYGIHQPVISNVKLTREEFAAFAPPEAVPGKEWVLPEAVVRKLCRVTSSMCYQHAPGPDCVVRAELHARVSEVAAGVARLTYAGRIVTRYAAGDFKKISIGRAGGEGTISQQEMTFTGEASCDVDSRSLRYVTLFGSGAIDQKWRSAAPVRIAGLVEWVREGPGEGGR